MNPWLIGGEKENYSTKKEAISCSFSWGRKTESIREFCNSIGDISERENGMKRVQSGKEVREDMKEYGKVRETRRD